MSSTRWRPARWRPAPERRAVWFGLVVLGALAVRVAAVAQPISLGVDATDYRRLALSLIHGHGFGVSHFAPAGGPTALRPPLYPLTLAGLYGVAGAHLVAARLAGALLGAVTVGLVMLICLEMWDATVALTAGAVAAVYPSLILASTSQMSEAIALPLELAAVLAALRHRDGGRAVAVLAAGAALGLAVLARPNLAVMVLPLLFLIRRRGAGRDWGRAALLVAAAAAVVLPWVVRDRLVMHAWVPVTTQDGYVLSGTYNHTSYSDPRYPGAWRPANLDPAVARLIEEHPGASEVQLDRLLLDQAERFAAAHPLYVLKVSAYNTARLFDAGGWAYTRSATRSEYGFPSPYGWAEIAGALAVAVLAAGGLLTLRRSAAPVSFWALPVLLWLSMVPIEVLPRFRAVIDPFLVMLAALALVGGVRAVRGSGGREAREVETPRMVMD